MLRVRPSGRSMTGILSPSALARPLIIFPMIPKDLLEILVCPA